MARRAPGWCWMTLSTRCWSELLAVNDVFLFRQDTRAMWLAAEGRAWRLRLQVRLPGLPAPGRSGWKPGVQGTAPGTGARAWGQRSRWLAGWPPEAAALHAGDVAGG